MFSAFIMRAIFFIAAIVAVAQSHIFLAPATVSATPQECQAIYRDFLTKGTELTVAVANQDWKTAEVLRVALIDVLTRMKDCFVDPHMHMFTAGALHVLHNATDDRRDCIMKYLNLAVAKFQAAIADLLKFEIQKFQHDVQLAIGFLQSALQDC